MTRWPVPVFPKQSIEIMLWIVVLSSSENEWHNRNNMEQKFLRVQKEQSSLPPSEWSPRVRAVVRRWCSWRSRVARSSLTNTLTGASVKLLIIIVFVRVHHSPPVKLEESRGRVPESGRRKEMHFLLYLDTHTLRNFKKLSVISALGRIWPKKIKNHVSYLDSRFLLCLLTHFFKDLY